MYSAASTGIFTVWECIINGFIRWEEICWKQFCILCISIKGQIFSNLLQTKYIKQHEEARKESIDLRCGIKSTDQKWMSTLEEKKGLCMLSFHKKSTFTCKTITAYGNKG